MRAAAPALIGILLLISALGVGMVVLGSFQMLRTSLQRRSRRPRPDAPSWGEILRVTAARKIEEQRRKADAGVQWSVWRDVERDGRIAIGVHREAPDGRRLEGPLNVTRYDPDDLEAQLSAEADALNKAQFYNRISGEKR